MSINIDQVRIRIIRPTLAHLAESGLVPYSMAAENLLVGTALVESAGEYIVQLGDGPALGPCQMEPFTHDDIWKNWLSAASRKPLVEKLRELETSAKLTTGAHEMIGNWYYAFAMCRVHYRRLPAALPPELDAQAMAAYWKKFYNTELGKGTIEKALPKFKIACQ